ncbi:hypothetical protein [Vibrio phage BONAISHI]|nr:hypothetical protein [Vibrio phage BONAISHI]
MAQPVIFELGNNGIITDPEALLRRAYVLAQLADQSQSVLFSSSVFSIQYLASVYGNDPSEYALQLEAAFRTYLSEMFEEGVTVSVSEKDPGEKIKYTLSISITATINGANYTLSGALFRDNAEDFTRLQDAII